MNPSSKKPIITLVSIGIGAVVLGLIIAAWTGGPSGGPGSGKERTAEDLSKLAVPKVGEAPPEEGVGVPGKVAEGEAENVGQQYWVFETELKDGKLDPFEFRVPVGDLLGIAITNSESETQTVGILGGSEFVPNFIERTVAPGEVASMRTQVLEIGEYEVLCNTCANQVVGKFIVVPK